MWAQIAMAAVNIVEGWGQASSKKKLAKAQYNYERSAAANEALNNASNNALAMADANLARYNQWRQDKKTMDSMGEALSQNSYNYGKTMDALSSNRFEQRISAAGNLGAIAASAAAAGVGGSSVDVVQQTEQMRQARQDNAMQNAIDDAQYVQGLNRTAIVDNAYSQLSTDPVFANLNYQAERMVVDNSWQHKYSLGKAAMDGFNGFSGNMNNIGINASEWTAGQEKKGTTGFGSASNAFSWFGGGGKSSASKGGSGAVRL